MSATDELRRLLDERGIEYEGFGSLDYILYTEWHVGDAICLYCESETEPIVLVHRMFDVTPEQAIAATLGAGECEITASATDGLCSDNPKHWFKLSCGHSFTIDGLEKPAACAVCGKAVC